MCSLLIFLRLLKLNNNQVNEYLFMISQYSSGMSAIKEYYKDVSMTVLCYYIHLYRAVYNGCQGQLYLGPGVWGGSKATLPHQGPVLQMAYGGGGGDSVTDFASGPRSFPHLWLYSYILCFTIAFLFEIVIIISGMISALSTFSKLLILLRAWMVRFYVLT